ncbi:MAG: hypothetical protein RSA78_08880, partial [Oscillospiraceae bacterium]
QLWRDEHFTSHVMYSWSQPIWTSYYQLKHLFKVQSPKVVVVDALGCSYGQFSFMPEQVDAVSNEFSLGMPMSIDRLQLALAMMRCQETKAPIGTYVPFIKYHSRWQYLKKEDFIYALKPLPHNVGKGYGPIYVHKEQIQMPNTSEEKIGKLNKYAEEYLYKLIKLCKNKEVKLIMMLTPHVFMHGEYEMYARVNEICKENDVPFINYNDDDLIERSGFSFAKDMAEKEHVNYHGARKLTQDMGEFLANEYELANIKHTDKQERIWNADLAIEERDEQNMELRLEAVPQLLAQKASEKGYILCVATKGKLNQAGKESARAFFAQLGLDDSVLDKSGMQCAAIIKDGKIIFAEHGENAKANAELLGKSFIVSASFDKANIAIDDKEHCRDREGINAVIYDSVSGKMIQSISFNAFDNYIAFTA